MNIIERNNVTIRGAGEQVMLFAHGYGCDQNIWRLLAPSFERDYEVVLFDHVGAGKSDISQYKRSRYATLQGFADDIIEIGERLEISRSIFVGHSVSATIGILAAIKNPNLFERLILISPSPCYFNEGDYYGGYSYDEISEMLQLLESNFESWAQVMAPLIMGNPERPELGRELTENFCRNKPEIARHFAQVTFLSDHRKDLVKLETPSLILQCREDKIAPETVGAYMHRVTKDADLCLLQARGHCPHVSAPEETARAMRNYLQKNT